MSPTSLILDFETLSLDPSAIVTEIGIIAVNRADFVTFDSLDIRTAVLPQLAMGRSWDAGTIRWHEKKGTLASIVGQTPIKDAVKSLVAFIEKHNPHRIWAWGKDFERPLFENLCNQLRVEAPDYQYRKFTCARDKWQDAFGVDTKQPERTHHAHQDCLDELRDLHKALDAMNLKHVF
jgi:hypothetical protein